MAHTPYLDKDALNAIFRPKSDWAIACGERVRESREALKCDIYKFADLVGVPMQTIYRIERGEIVPKDYLRHAIAYATNRDVSALFPPLSLREMYRRAA